MQTLHYKGKQKHLTLFNFAQLVAGSIRDAMKPQRQKKGQKWERECFLVPSERKKNKQKDILQNKNINIKSLRWDIHKAMRYIIYSVLYSNSELFCHYRGTVGCGSLVESRMLPIMQF